MSQNAITPSTRGWWANGLKGLSVLVSAVALLVACEEAKEIGLPPTTPVGIVYTDTLTIRKSTILLDSVQTSRTNRLLVGHYQDPIVGRVDARAFAQLDFGTDATSGTNIQSVKLDNDVVYDSLKFVTSYVNAYGDTTKTQEIFLHRLTEDLDTTKRYTNKSSASYAPTPLAQITLTSGPGSYTSSISAKLPDALGQELLTLFKGNGITRLDIRKAFKGLAFIPGSRNTSVVELPVSSYFTVFYHKPDATTASGVSLVIDPVQPSPITYRPTAFNQILTNRAGSRLAGLQTANTLPASATGGQLFVQNATGVTTKLEFPTFENLKKLGRIAINRAELTITPKATVSGTSLPLYMALAEVTPTNQLRYTDRNSARLLHFVQTNTGTFQQSAQWYSPEVALIGDRTRSAYAYDVSGYFQALVTNFQTNTGLALVPTSAPAGSLVSASTGSYLAQAYLNTQLTAAVFNESDIKLVVFYTLTQ